MREYETIYLLKPDLPQDQVKTLQGRLSEIVQKSGGHVLHHTDWGKRKLAYRVHKFKQGQYVYLQFLDNGPSVAEIERILKNDDKTLRFLTVKLHEMVDAQERLAKPSDAPPPPEEYVDEMAAEMAYSRSGASHRPSRPGPIIERGDARQEDGPTDEE